MSSISSRPLVARILGVVAAAVAVVVMAAAGAAPQAEPAPSAPVGAAEAGSDDAARGAVPDPSSTAVVMEVVGRVRVRDSADGPWRALRENEVLRAGAEVQSGLRSHAALRLGRDATMLIDAGTTLVIPELREEQGTLITRTAVKTGRADLKVDKVGFQTDFRVLTPTTTIAVAGTTLGIQSGRLRGTEVTGARTNAIAAIEARWMERRLAFFFGDGRSTTEFPDPAQGGIDDTVRRNLMPGVVTDRAQLEQAWATGSLQNVIFNINNLQRILNLDQTILEEQLASVAVLAQLLAIRDATAVLATEGQGAAALAAAFAQKASQLSSQAQQMLPQLQVLLDEQAGKAKYAAIETLLARKAAESEQQNAEEHRDEAVDFLSQTIAAIENRDYERAQIKADASAYAAMLASQAAMYAGEAANDAFAFASVAAQAAASAQAALDQYKTTVTEIGVCAAQASAQAAIAANAASASAALQVMAQQLAAAIPDGGANGILDQINANVLSASAAAANAALSRDQALSAAANAPSMGERFLYNWAAVFASQAAADAAAAGVAANGAALAADEAKAAAALALELAYGKGGGKGGGD